MQLSPYHCFCDLYVFVKDSKNDAVADYHLHVLYTAIEYCNTVKKTNKTMTLVVHKHEKKHRVHVFKDIMIKGLTVIW